MNASTDRAKPARWRKQPSEGGLRSIGQGPRGYELRQDGEVIIAVHAYGGSALGGSLKGWYWYGMGVNTCNTKPLFKTKEEAKADADAHYKANRK
jgi:hypothetical protein